MAKINDNGTTNDFSDDVLLPGATFAFYLDDGDGLFEPGTDDIAVGQVTSDTGWHRVVPPGPGDYWVVEQNEPEGFDVAPPLLVPFGLDHASENCLVTATETFCVPDDDPDGGYLVVVVADSPLAGVGAVTPPPTDVTASIDTERQSGLAVALAALSGLAAASIVLSTRRRHQRR